MYASVDIHVNKWSFTWAATVQRYENWRIFPYSLKARFTHLHSLCFLLLGEHFRSTGFSRPLCLLLYILKYFKLRCSFNFEPGGIARFIVKVPRWKYAEVWTSARIASYRLVDYRQCPPSGVDKIRASDARTLCTPTPAPVVVLYEL